MEDLAADFIIENNQPLEMEAEISEPEHFDCSFELYASGTTWGSISGTLSNQTDLQAALDLKADKSEVESVTGALADSIQAVDNKYDSITSGLDDSITAIDNKYDSITGALDDKIDSINGALSDDIDALESITSGLSDSITAIDNTIDNFGDIVNYNAADFATSIQGALADSALQPNDNISELNNDVGYITAASLPTVNDGELTIKVNGSSIATFTANQGTDTIADISIPNAAEWGNITGTLSDQTDLQNALDAKVTNNATGTKALAVGNTSQSTAEGGVAVGYGARANSTYATAVGEEARANNTNTTVIGKAAKATEARAIAIGSGAEANAQDAIAIKGINNTANTFQVYTYNMLDMSTGLIPDARISSNIARTVDIPSLTNYVTTNTAQTISQPKAFSQPLVIADNNGIASGTLLSSKKILQRSSGDNTLTLNNKDNKLRLVGSETRPKYSTDGSTYGDLALYSDVSAISDLIPSAATVSNQLADKNFVNSSIATNTANFIGTFNSVAELEAYSGTLTNNDYAFVVGTDAEGNTVYDRYKYTDATTPPSWIFEYELNNSSFTAAQWDAINSGITSGDVALIATALQSGDNVSALVNDAGYITSSALSGYATETWVGNQGYALASSLATVATSGDYTDLLNTPTIPTVDQTYDSTSVNAQSGVAIAGAGFLTGITSGDVTSALGYTPYNSSNPDGFITSAALSNYLQKDVAQSTTGTITFVGQKKIEFKQSAAADKLGFTLYNSSNTELGAFEYRPNTISGKALLNVNCPYTGDYVGFRYWGTAVNVVAPKVATAGTYYIPTHITDGNTTVTANNAGVVDISSLISGGGGTVDQVYDPTSINAQAGVAIAGAHFVPNLSYSTNGLAINVPDGNTSTYTSASNNSIAIGGIQGTNLECVASGTRCIQLGYGTNSESYTFKVGSSADYNWKLLDMTTGKIPDDRLNNALIKNESYNSGGIAIAIPNGNQTSASSTSIAIGGTSSSISNSECIASGDRCIQLGYGTNSTNYTLKVGSSSDYNWTLLDMTNGLIPDARLSSNIARTSQIPDISTKQDTLVSGSNIKTINNTSLLGSGNIDTSEIFIATYGTTTYADVLNAFNNGKIIGCKDLFNQFAFLTIKDTQTFYFGFGSVDTESNYYILDETNGWSLQSLNLANTNLSNLSSTGKKVIDGQWVRAANEISNSKTVGTTSLKSNINSIIPNDGHVYELILDIVALGNGNNSCELAIQSTLCYSPWVVWISNGSTACARLVVPVAADRELNKIITSNAFNACSVYLSAYRRIGSNS